MLILFPVKIIFMRTLNLNSSFLNVFEGNKENWEIRMKESMRLFKCTVAFLWPVKLTWWNLMRKNGLSHFSLYSRMHCFIVVKYPGHFEIQSKLYIERSLWKGNNVICPFCVAASTSSCVWDCQMQMTSLYYDHIHFWFAVSISFLFAMKCRTKKSE